MCVHLRPAILQKSAHVLEVGKHRLAMTCQRRLRRRRKPCTSPRRVLVQREHRKNVPKDHSSKDQADSSQNEQPPSAKRRKSGNGFPGSAIPQWSRSAQANPSITRFSAIFPLTIFKNVLCFYLYEITPPLRRRRFCF